MSKEQPQVKEARGAIRPSQPLGSRICGPEPWVRFGEPEFIQTPVRRIIPDGPIGGAKIPMALTNAAQRQSLGYSGPVRH
jgi:hypothetical protein